MNFNQDQATEKLSGGFGPHSAEAQNLWNSVLRHMEEKHPPTAIHRWLSPLRLERLNDQTDPCELHLVAAQEFVVGFIRQNYLESIKELLFKLSGRVFELHFSVGTSIGAGAPQGASLGAVSEPEKPSQAIAHFQSAHESAYDRQKANASESLFATTLERQLKNRELENNATDSSRSLFDPRPVSPSTLYSSPLTFGGAFLQRQHFPDKDVAHQKNPSIDPRYTFDSFVVGSSNQLAHAAAVAVSENPGLQYNPLFLYSAPGLGKTHLLYAIANQILARNPQARILYISAEVFVNELIEAIAGRTMTQFRTQYRDSYDAILFDDIQFIAGKEKTEEEFFHTFNALHAARKQIVVSSDRPPKEIKDLQARLRTRFEWGLVVDITPPEIETRIAILKTKAERDDLYLPDDVANYLATHIKSNIRELEGILIKLQAHARLTGSELSLELAKMHLQDLIPEQSSSYTVEQIQLAVAKHFKIRVGDFKSSSKLRSVARPRQIAMFLVRKYSSLGLKEIGEAFGGRDHSTVIHACREIERMIETDEELRKAVEAVQNQL